MQLTEFNVLEVSQAQAKLFECCACDAWVAQMLANRPFSTLNDLHDCAEKTWMSLSEQDWLQAFDGHPKIGDPDSLKEKYKATSQLATHEQSGVSGASSQVLEELVDYNQRYWEKFGFIFIVCATGKSAEEMLNLIKLRLPNSRKNELTIAAGEQAKISAIRLDKLLGNKT